MIVNGCCNQEWERNPAHVAQLPRSAWCLVLICNDSAWAERTRTFIDTLAFVNECWRSACEAYISFLFFTKVTSIIALETSVRHSIWASSLGTSLVTALFVQVNGVTNGIITRNTVLDCARTVFTRCCTFCTDTFSFLEVDRYVGVRTFC